MKRNLVYLTTVFITVFTFLLVSCASRSRFVFQSSKDAVDASRNMLNELRKTETADIEKLTAFISDWRILQDTVMTKLMNDSSQLSLDLAEDFFVAADSIKIEIKRVAYSKPRTLNDILFLRLNTAKNIDEWIDKKSFADAKDFFENLDKEKTYPTLKESLQQYYSLLNKTRKFQKEGEMLEFIVKEDKCFRSLMEHLSEVKQQDLIKISGLTSDYFDKLTAAVSQKINDETCKRISMYLTMRINRRVVQNADACRLLLNKKPHLDQTQSQMFKWMIVQPFFTLDDYSAALITKNQEKVLNSLAKEIPQLFSFIDGIDISKGKKEEQEKLIDTLNEYFLKSFLDYSL